MCRSEPSREGVAASTHGLSPDRDWTNRHGVGISYGYPPSTPWWRLVKRVVWARRRGFKIKLQVEVNGTWMWGGWRR